jgi:hypothetical protein
MTIAAKSERRKIKVAPDDSADYQKTEEDIKNYLQRSMKSPWIGRCRFTRSALSLEHAA